MAEYVSATYKGKKILRHRLIWINHHGDIPSDCIIHHINGNKWDNRIENLECITRRDHRFKHKRSPEKEKEVMAYARSCNKGNLS
jgi:hypothetical protein